MGLSKTDREALESVLSDYDSMPGILSPELVNAVDRALRAGARPPLTYLGAGMTAIVFADRVRRAYKVGRHPDSDVAKRIISTEAEYLEDAKQVPALRDRVVRFEKFYPWPLLVIVNEEVRRAHTRPYGVSLWDAHEAITAVMKPRGWGRPEFKEDSYIIAAHGPVLVDASSTLRFGPRLLEYARSIATGDRPRNGEANKDLRWEIEFEVSDGRISQEDADAVLMLLA